MVTNQFTSTPRQGGEGRAGWWWPWGVEEWETFSASSLACTTPAWAAAWVDAFGAQYSPGIEPGSEAWQDVILPLVRRRRGPARLELLGARELFEPADVLSPNPEAVAAAVSDLAARGKCLDLRRVPVESVLLPAVRAAYRGRGAVLVRPADPCPTMPLDPSWAEPERHMSSRRRSDLRRAARRAEELGEVAYEVVNPLQDDLEARMDEFVALEAAGWKTRAGTALGCQPAHERFFRTYARLVSQRAALRLSFLRIDGRPVATQFAVHHGDRLWLLKIGYDETFARCSPGTLLLLDSVSRAAKEGAKSVEFLGAAEPWTDRWTTAVRPHVHILAYGRTPWSAACAAQDASRLARASVRAARRRRAERSGEPAPDQRG